MDSPLLLIHGMFASGKQMERMRAAFLQHGFDAQAPSLPGHGDGVAAEAVAGLSLNDYVRAMHEAIDRLWPGAEPIVVGHSMGGLIAQRVAAERRVRALMLLAPAPMAGQRYNPLPALPMYLGMLKHPWPWRASYRPSAEMFARIALPGIEATRHAEMHAAIGYESQRAILEIAAWMLDHHHAARVDCSAVRAPVYLGSGGLDLLVPPAAVKATALRYPAATLRSWPERGHILIDDAATEDMVADMADWLEQRRRSALLTVGSTA